MWGPSPDSCRRAGGCTGTERRGFHALDVVEVDDAGMVTRKDTFFDYAEVKAALEATK